MTARELWPVAEALRLWPHLFRNNIAICAVDNAAACFALCRFNSRCPRSHRILTSIHRTATALNTLIIPIHVPREFTPVADALSRFHHSWTGTLDASKPSPSSCVALSRAVYSAACSEGGA